MNQYLLTFLKNAILGGIFVGLIMVIMEMKFYKLGGFVYGALPFTFIYIMLMYFFYNCSYNDKVKRLMEFSNFTIVGAFLFIVIISIYYFTLKYTKNLVKSCISLLVASIIIIGLSIYYTPSMR